MGALPPAGGRAGGTVRSCMNDLLSTPTVRILFLGPLLAATLLTPLVMKLSRRLGVVDTGGYRRVHVQPTPLMGGLALVVPFVAVCGLAILGPTTVLERLAPMRRDLVMLAVGAVLIAMLGMLDDAFGLRARYKLLGQIVIAGIVSVMRAPFAVSLPLVGDLGLSSTASFVFSIFWIVALINAFNLVDGVDGLAAGIGLIVAGGLVAIARTHGQDFVVVFVVVTMVTLAGCLLGFLVHNSHPARIFLGDTGSMFIGYALASVSLMGNYKTSTAAMTLAPFLVFGFPLFETSISMLRRFVQGKPIFAADQHHTHHRLLRMGHSQRRTVYILYLVTFLCVTAAYMQDRHPWGSHLGWIGASVYCLTLAWIGWYAGYFRLGPLNRILFRRRQNQVFNAFARYASLTLRTGSGAVKLEAVLDLARKELGLRFLQVWLEDGALLLATSGTPHAVGKDFGTLDQVERLRVKTSEGDVVLIRFEIAKSDARRELQDVTACLAGIFDEFRIPESPGAQIVAIQPVAKSG